MADTPSYKFMGLAPQGAIVTQAINNPSGTYTLPAVVTNGGNTTTTSLIIALKPSVNWAPGSLMFNRGTDFTVEYSCSGVDKLTADRDGNIQTNAMWFTATPAQFMQILTRITAVRIKNTSTSDSLIVEWVL